MFWMKKSDRIFRIYGKKSRTSLSYLTVMGKPDSIVCSCRKRRRAMQEKKKERLGCRWKPEKALTAVHIVNDSNLLYGAQIKQCLV